MPPKCQVSASPALWALGLALSSTLCVLQAGVAWHSQVFPQTGLQGGACYPTFEAFWIRPFWCFLFAKGRAGPADDWPRAGTTSSFLGREMSTVFNSKKTLKVGVGEIHPFLSLLSQIAPPSLPFGPNDVVVCAEEIGKCTGENRTEDMKTKKERNH